MSFKKGMKGFGENITIIVNSVLLSLVYFIGVGFTSMFAKLIGKRFLDIKKNRETYWDDLNLKKEDLKRYYRQF